MRNGLRVWLAAACYFAVGAGIAQVGSWLFHGQAAAQIAFDLIACVGAGLTWGKFTFPRIPPK